MRAARRTKIIMLPSVGMPDAGRVARLLLSSKESAMSTRADINNAWAEGLKSGKTGKGKVRNPHMGVDTDKAKAWNEGWKEGSDFYQKQRK